MELPDLGVGLTYNSGLEPVFEAHADRIGLVEVEPQTLWFREAGGGYRVDREAVDRIADLPGARLLHGIGFPVGGLRPPDPSQLPPLLEMTAALSPPWMSEHLSFNRAGGAGGEFLTGFLLPPRQTPAGVRAAADSIRAMAGELPVPLAVETGVNYLRPRRDEMSDGRFTAAVLEAAGCGLLLDLHNLWANQRNGRQRVDEFLDEIPLERVWEIHLAGGTERHGYWLDSHAGGMPDPLEEVAVAMIPRLPNLRAIVFEVFPDYLPTVGLAEIGRQLERLQRLWDRRGRASRRAAAGAERPAAVVAAPAAAEPEPAGADSAGPDPREWEDTLGALVVGRRVASALGSELAGDPGLAVIRELVGDFRAGMVAESLKLTTRLLFATVGKKRVRSLLAEFFDRVPPSLFAAEEGEGFAAWLAGRDGFAVPYLAPVLAYERALLATLHDGEPRIVAFPFDPLPVLRALGEGRLPDPALVGTGEFEIEVTPPGDAEPGGDESDLRALAVPQVFHR